MTDLSALGPVDDLVAAVADQLRSGWILAQIAILAVVAALAWMSAALIRRRLDLTSLTLGWPLLLRRIIRTVVANLGVLVFLLLLVIARAGLWSALRPLPGVDYLLRAGLGLAGAWLAIHFVTGFIRNAFVLKIVAISAWLIAALAILGILDQTTEALDAAAITISGFRLSALLVIKTIALLLLGLWVAVAVSDFVERRLRGATDLTPSIQVLIAKLARFGLITLAVLVVLSSVGIDLSALAVFSGAVGVGIGFGLQKIVSNFLCGIILLADKSIKPGDVLSVGDTLGWIVSMGARHTTVTTRDGREILIPNEDLVTHKVVNWSYSKDEIRLDVRFGVDVASNPHEVRRVAVEAAATVERVLKTPPPVCHFVAFGSASLDFVLRFWISDPIEGATNVRGAALLALWDALQRADIKIPSPVQELHLQGRARFAMDASADDPSLTIDAPKLPAG